MSVTRRNDAARVTLLVRSDSLAAGMSDYLIRQIQATPNVEVRLRTRVVEGRGAIRLEALMLEEIALEHRTPDRTYGLGTVRVSERPVERSFAREFGAIRHSEELAAVRERLEAYHFDRPPDKGLAIVGEMPGMGHHGDHGQAPAIEWEDTMPMMNETSTRRDMRWRLIDRERGEANHDIRWSFGVGERVKVRIVNEPDTDHPMQHPIHFHGQRFLVLARDGVRNPNLAWKDTELVRTGQTTDILVEMSNPGLWMVHCHIAEHLEGGMMFSFDVGV